jgi:hypothetical protein
VTERIGNDKYTDAKPVGTSTYVGKGYFSTNASTSCGDRNSHPTRGQHRVSLTDDKDVLKRRIAKLTTVRRHGWSPRHRLGLVSASSPN